MQRVELFPVTEYDRAVGYDLSYGVARVSTELGTGVATGAFAAVSKIGTGLLVLDAAVNAVLVGQGVSDMLECGVDLGEFAAGRRRSLWRWW